MSCKNKTTPEGHLTTIDLRSHLTEEVVSRAPEKEDALSYKEKIPINEISAELLVQWHAFEDSGDMYLLAADIQVVQAAKDYKISVNTSGPLNRGTTENVVEAVPIYISWVKETTFKGIKAGNIAGEIMANGELLIFE